MAGQCGVAAAIRHSAGYMSRLCVSGRRCGMHWSAIRWRRECMYRHRVSSIRSMIRGWTGCSRSFRAVRRHRHLDNEVCCNRDIPETVCQLALPNVYSQVPTQLVC